jgi:hypothetical protein
MDILVYLVHSSMQLRFLIGGHTSHMSMLTNTSEHDSIPGQKQDLTRQRQHIKLARIRRSHTGESDPVFDFAFVAASSRVTSVCKIVNVLVSFAFTAAAFRFGMVALL